MDVQLINSFNQFALLDGINHVENKPVRRSAKKSIKQSITQSVRIQSLIDCPFDYFVCLDVECTCDADDPTWPHELIEIGVAVISTKSIKQSIKQSNSNGFDEIFHVDREFRTFVKPRHRPELTEFCTQLTGVTQSDVDDAPIIDEAIDLFDRFIREHYADCSMLLVTDGEWDVLQFIEPELNEFYQSINQSINNPPIKLPNKPLVTSLKNQSISQCLPSIFRQFCDVRKVFRTHFNQSINRTRHRRDLRYMLSHVNLSFAGRQHCGLIDARNVARLVWKLFMLGAVIDINTYALVEQLKR